MIAIVKLRGTGTLVCALCALMLGSVAAASTGATSPTRLQVPSSIGYSVLAAQCKNGRQYYLQQQDYGTQFDPASGYPDGDAYVTDICNIGRINYRHSAWLSATWDFTGAFISYAVVGTPTVNPNLSIYDAHGNHLYNQTGAAYIQLAAGFVPAPRVLAISPSSAPQGTTVTISGTGFTAASGVSFGTTPAAGFTVTNDSTITAIAPAIRTGAVDVTVSSSGGTSATSTADRFTFTLTPRVSGLSPNNGSADGGDSVTITGVNFTGATSVTFGGMSATFKVLSDTTIQAVSPGVADPITVDVVVGSAYGYSTATSADRFTYF